MSEKVMCSRVSEAETAYTHEITLVLIRYHISNKPRKTDPNPAIVEIV